MHKDAHTFQLPLGSCLVGSAAPVAFDHFIAVIAAAHGVKFSDCSTSTTPRTEDRPEVHRMTIVLDSEREGAARPVLEAAQRAVHLSGTCSPERFIERMQAGIAAAESGSDIDLAPELVDPRFPTGIDVGVGSDVTAHTTIDTATGKVLETRTEPSKRKKPDTL